uniref:Uncharacterized protein n=1 Tax=Solanum lycopersicum TaxID=4081 RepID=A0A494G8X1_SOLLC
MTSQPFHSTHGRMMSGEACHHRLRAAHTVRLRRAWHDITALGQHTRSDDVRHGMTSPPVGSTQAHTVERRRAWHSIIAFGQHTRSSDVGHDMSSPPLDNTLGRTTSAHTIGNDGRAMTSPPFDSIHGQQRRAWHGITALGQHTRSDDVGRSMTSPPLDRTHGRTTLGVA